MGCNFRLCSCLVCSSKRANSVSARVSATIVLLLLALLSSLLCDARQRYFRLAESFDAVSLLSSATIYYVLPAPSSSPSLTTTTLACARSDRRPSWRAPLPTWRTSSTLTTATTATRATAARPRPWTSVRSLSVCSIAYLYYMRERNYCSIPTLTHDRFTFLPLLPSFTSTDDRPRRRGSAAVHQRQRRLPGRRRGHGRRHRSVRKG